MVHNETKLLRKELMSDNQNTVVVAIAQNAAIIIGTLIVLNVSTRVAHGLKKKFGR